MGIFSGLLLSYQPVSNLETLLEFYKFETVKKVFINGSSTDIILNGFIKLDPMGRIKLKSGKEIDKCLIFQEFLLDVRSIEYVEEEKTQVRIKGRQEKHVKEGFFFISRGSFIFLISTGEKRILIDAISNALYRISDHIRNVTINLESLEASFPRLWHATIRRRDQNSILGININSGYYFGEDITSDSEQGEIISSKRKRSIGFDARIDNKLRKVKINGNGMLQFPGLDITHIISILNFIDIVVLPFTSPV